MTQVLLNRALVLENRVGTPDGAGGQTETWVPLGTLWAQVAPGSGKQGRTVDGALADTPMVITVRGAPVGSEQRPVPGQRFRDGSRIFGIEAVSEADNRAQFLTCFAREEVAR